MTADAPEAEVLRLPGDGLTLAAEAYGPSAGRPVIFLHGGGQSRSSWRGVAQAVGRAGYRGFTLDLRGHGASDWAADGDYLLDAYARDVAHLIGSFVRPVTLVGASRGGQSALVGASRRQEKVDLVVLADCAPRISDTGVEQIRRFLHRSLQGFQSVAEAAEALAELLEKPRAANPAALRKMMREESGRLFWCWDPASVRPEFLNPPSETAAMIEAARRMRKPVTLVHAEHSTVVRAGDVEHFRSLTPQLEVIVARGVGHMFTGDRNDAFAATLLEQLARTGGPK